VFLEAKDDGGGGDNWTTVSRQKKISFKVLHNTPGKEEDHRHHD